MVDSFFLGGGGVDGGGVWSVCRRSIIRNGNVALLNLRKTSCRQFGGGGRTGLAPPPFPGEIKKEEKKKKKKKRERERKRGGKQGAPVEVCEDLRTKGGGGHPNIRKGIMIWHVV